LGSVGPEISLTPEPSTLVENSGHFGNKEALIRPVSAKLR